MTLTDLAALGSFISGVAVVISFVFLALQMRQSNLNQRALMQQGRTARTLGAFSQMVDPYISSITVRAQADAELDSSEVNSIMRVVGYWFWNYEDSFLQYRSGTLDKSSWESDVESLKYMLTDPACRVSWRMMRSYMGGPFRDYVDSLMRETKVTPISDFAATWKTLMKEERASL
jgi:hypothetical protein